MQYLQFSLIISLIQFQFMSSIVQSCKTSAFTYHFKSKMKSHLTEYIIDQDQADKQIRLLLNYLRIITCFTNSKQEQQQNKIIQNNPEILSTLSQHLLAVNTRHRSYLRIRSLVFIGMAKIAAQQNDYINALEYVQQAKIADQLSDSSHFSARSLLFQIYVLSKMQNLSNIITIQYNKTQPLVEINNQEDQFQENILSNDKGKIQQNNEISLLYRQFKKIKFLINYEQLEIQERLWQHREINQLLAYQYQDIIKELSEIYPKKAEMLYLKGIQISKRYLGESHRLTLILINIKQIRQSRKKLLSTAVSSSKSIRTRKCKKAKDNSEIKQAVFKSTFNQRTKSLLHDVNYSKDKKAKSGIQFYKQRQKKSNQKYYLKEKKNQKTLMSQYINTPEMAKLDLLQRLYSQDTPNQKKFIQQVLKKQVKKLDKLEDKYIKKPKQDEYLKVPKKKIVRGKIINQQQLIRRCNANDSNANKNIQDLCQGKQIALEKHHPIEKEKEEIKDKIQQDQQLKQQQDQKADIKDQKQYFQNNKLKQKEQEDNTNCQLI